METHFPQQAMFGDTYSTVSSEVEAILTAKPELDFMGVVEEIFGLRGVELTDEVREIIRSLPSVDRQIRKIKSADNTPYLE